MSYAFADLPFFQKRKQQISDEKSVVSVAFDIQETYRMSDRLVALALKHKHRLQSEARSRVAVQELIMALEETKEAKEETIDSRQSLIQKVVKKVFKTVGRKLFENIVKPIFRFAIRMTMNLVRTMLTAVTEYILVPAAEFIVGFALANPITAGIFATLLVVGGGYWIWKKFFASSDDTTPALDKAVVKPEVGFETVKSETSTSSAQDLKVDTSDVALSNEDQTVAVEPTVANIFEKPLQFVRSKISSGAKDKKFTGFGADVDKYIVEASKLSGVPEDVLRGFVKMEAGWTGAMSPTGAIGTGQFIQPTWDSLADTPEGKSIGMTKIGSRFRTPEDPRFNKRINTLATGLLAAQNAKLLAKYGLPLTGENLYMLHNIGPGIIQVMLGRPASAAVIKAMQQNGMLSGQTASQFLEMQKQKFNAQYSIANSSTVIDAASKAQYATGVTVGKQGSNMADAAQSAASGSNTQTSTGTATDKQIIRGKGKTLIEVS